MLLLSLFGFGVADDDGAAGFLDALTLA